MEEKTLTNWQAVGIGVLIGTLLPLTVWFAQYFVYAIPIFIYSGWLAIIFSIAGALIGKRWKKSKQAV